MPANLLDEPQQVVPGTVSLTDEAIARAQRIRATARHAVLDLQDDRSLRKALSARPRTSRDFRPGDLAAYWRLTGDPKSGSKESCKTKVDGTALQLFWGT